MAITLEDLRVATGFMTTQGKRYKLLKISEVLLNRKALDTFFKFYVFWSNLRQRLENKNRQNIFKFNNKAIFCDLNNVISGAENGRAFA